jgi:2',3'-cyclic-nucleotide 2'-phosphodiesterase (5'-nucleotidase family)
MNFDVLQYGMLVLLLLACLATGCRAKVGGDGRSLVIVVSGDTAGWIVPCGCTTNQSGGLPRRGTFVEQLRREANVVLLDAGGAPLGTSAYDRVKFEAILAGEKLMGVAAHNLGAAEARLGPDELRRLAANEKAAFISANVFDATDRPLAEPLRIVDVSGRRLAIVGVLSQRYTADKIHVKPPRQAILESVRQASGRYDWLIILAYLPEDELRELAQSLPEADVIVGGPTGQPIAPKRTGPVLLTSATNKGKFLARLEAPQPGSSRGWTGRIEELSDRYTDDPRQTANIEKYHRELVRRDFLPDQTSLVEPLSKNMPRDFAIAGTDTCQECHADDCSLWRKSKHAQAWTALKQKNAQYDPDCQRCHTTGYGQPGGFSSVRSGGRLTDVGCENCHGPSKAHVNDDIVLTAYYAQAKDRCISCHDRENSPEFNYDKYWAKIVHGEWTEDYNAMDNIGGD